jgi:ribonucleoside-diphosphate reductase alpha chain
MMLAKDYDFSNLLWQQRYKTTLDCDIYDMMERVGRAVAAPESDSSRFEREFVDLLQSERFLPAGRVLINAGSPWRRACLTNTFVMPPLEDSIPGIWTGLRQAAVTLQSGGGLGQDFSNLRQNGAQINGGQGFATGPVSALPLWNETCRYIQGGGAHRGAMLAGLSVHHPDVLDFIQAKDKIGSTLEYFNLSVIVTDQFVDALQRAESYPIYGPGQGEQPIGYRNSVEVWERIIERIGCSGGEPGLLFVDRANRLNNLRYCETLLLTNSCGEQWLPAWGSAILGAFNLPLYVQSPFRPDASFDLDRFENDLVLAHRFMDNVHDINWLPRAEYQAEIVKTRRVGLGVFGLGSMLALMGARYGSAESLLICRRIFDTMVNVLYSASACLARERGAFPSYQPAHYLDSPFVGRLHAETRQLLKAHGARNSHLLCCQPAGLLSSIFGCVSNGIEPIFGLEYARMVRTQETPSPRYEEFACEDYAWRIAKATCRREELPSIPTVRDISLSEQFAVHQLVSEYMDSGVSKTMNFAANCTSAEIEGCLRLAVESREVKGITFAALDAPVSQVKMRVSS